MVLFKSIILQQSKKLFPLKTFSLQTSELDFYNLFSLGFMTIMNAILGTASKIQMCLELIAIFKKKILFEHGSHLCFRALKLC